MGFFTKWIDWMGSLCQVHDVVRDRLFRVFFFFFFILVRFESKKLK